MKKSIFFLALILIINCQLSIVNCYGQYTKLLDFDGSANGRKPNGTLFSDGTFLYGMTENGGINNMGTIFKIMPDGTGYSKLLDFLDTVNGNTPLGSLVSDGSFLYGMTSGGSTNSMGTIFKIMPDGTGYSKLLDFTGVANGNMPRGSLIFDGTFLYGMTRYGGTSSISGTLFKIMPDGTGYYKLLDFADGSDPFGTLISDGTFLYGMTEHGGINGMGTIFKIMPDGTGYSILLDFTGLANGKLPVGDLISDGTFLYGMTEFGGANDMGVLFKIMPDGTGYSKLLDFTGVANGSYREGSLISDGNILYGMTLAGGINNKGVLFKIMPDGSGYSKLLDFSGLTNGSYPKGSLISDSTFLYGMTFEGGVNDFGTIFKYALVNGVEKNNTKKTFDVYPNPSNGTFTIATKENEYSLIITNVLGEKIYQSEMKSQNLEIDLNKQSNGIYFINIQTDKESYTQKIIVNR